MTAGITNEFYFRGSISIGQYWKAKSTTKITGPAIADAKNWYEKAD